MALSTCHKPMIGPTVLKWLEGSSSFWLGGFRSTSTNNGTTLWNSVPKSGLWKFHHCMSIITMCCAKPLVQGKWSIFWFLAFSVTFLQKIIKSIYVCQSQSKPICFETQCKREDLVAQTAVLQPAKLEQSSAPPYKVALQHIINKVHTIKQQKLPSVKNNIIE